jgi:hypothetical protein
MPCNRSREIDDALRRLAETAGAYVEFEPQNRGNHRRVYFNLNGRTRFDTLSNSPSSVCVLHNAVAQARRTLRSLGASL